MAVSGAGPPGPPFLFSVVCPVPPNFRERTRDILLLQELHAPGTSSVFPGFPPIRQGKEIKMKALIKYTAAVALTGAIALAAATPSEARNGRNAAAIGFGVGAIAGAAIASSAYNEWRLLRVL
jgi:hypothetical protein